MNEPANQKPVNQKPPKQKGLNEKSEQYGHDERSLLKLPFTTVGKSNSDQAVMETEWTQIVDGKEKTFFKRVTGDSEHGLPSFAAEELFMSLLYESVQRELPRLVVVQRPARLLRRMQWGTRGDDYNRLRRALGELQSVSIHTNALWDDQAKRFREAKFGIIDDWMTADKSQEKIDRFKGRPFQARWNKILLDQLKRGRIKVLDLSTYYSFSSNTAKRLYRLLDEALYPNKVWSIDLKHLAYHRLEISRSQRYPSQILQSLESGLNEIEAAGLCTWEIKDSQTASGKKIVFRAAGEPGGISGDAQSENIVQWYDNLPDAYQAQIRRKALARISRRYRKQYEDRGRKATAAWSFFKNALEEVRDELLTQ